VVYPAPTDAPMLETLLAGPRGAARVDFGEYLANQVDYFGEYLANQVDCLDTAGRTPAMLAAARLGVYRPLAAGAGKAMGAALRAQLLGAADAALAVLAGAGADLTRGGGRAGARSPPPPPLSLPFSLPLSLCFMHMHMHMLYALCSILYALLSALCSISYALSSFPVFSNDSLSAPLDISNPLIHSSTCTASPPRTKWTRRVHHPVLIGHAASLTPY